MNQCPLCNVDLDVAEPHFRTSHLALEVHLENAHGLEKLPDSPATPVHCFCGMAFGTWSQRSKHLESITDWREHITLGVLQKL